MRRKGLGEKPSVAFNEGQNHVGRKARRQLRLRAFCRYCRIDPEHETKGFHAMAFGKSPLRGLKSQVILEAGLSNRGEAQSLLFSLIR